jgi:hypothetical protein
MARLVVAVAAAAMVLGGCTAASEFEGGMLALVDESGDVAIITETGEAVAQVTDLSGAAVAFQPVWSGADHVVFVERAGVVGDLVVAASSGEEQRRASFATAPFYAFPRPGTDGEGEILLLRNSLGGDGLAAELVLSDASVTNVGGGAPFYVTWTKEGSLVGHVGTDVLGELYPEVRRHDAMPGAFGPPAAWGDAVVYIRAAGSSSYLSVLRGEQSEDVASVSGPANLVVGGDRVALRPVATEPTVGGIEVRAQRLPSIPANTLVVVGLEDGTATTVAAGDIVSFFWDPTATRLLYLEIVDAAVGEVAWHVWEGGTTTDFATFTVDPEWWIGFTPFFDQYAQSMTLWAPDGSAFAYPARDGEDSAVWVQWLDAEAPVRVASGSWVAWGPAG